MSGVGVMTAGWLLRSALGGGLILLLVYLIQRRSKQPARQQRLGEWGLGAALVLALVAALPGWLVVSVPAPPPHETAQPAPAPAAVTPHEPEAATEVSPDTAALLAWLLMGPDEAVAEPQAPAPSVAEPPPVQESPSPTPAAASITDLLPLLLNGLAVIYLAVAGGLLLRWLLGHAGLWRLLRTATPAPAEVVRLFEEMTPSRWRPRLLVSDRLRSPITCGLFRPAVVLPRSLCDQPGPLRWVFAHELAHLQRCDLWSCWLFGLGQVVYFYLPWFWWVRGQVRLCQEYLADAAVLDQDDAPADYAQFLLSLNAGPLPAGATGVSGRPSELFRRVKMLLGAPAPLERRCPGLWSCAVAGVLVGSAVCFGGLRLIAEPAPRPSVGQDSAPDMPSPAGAESRRHEAEPLAPPAVPVSEPGPVPEPTPPAEPAPVPAPPRVPEGLVLGDDGRLGVRVEKVDATLADQLGLAPRTGLVVVEVMPDSSAARAGIKIHDVLVSVAGRPVPGDPRELAFLLAGLPSGSPLECSVIRKGQRLTLSGLSLPEPAGPSRLTLFRPEPLALPRVRVAPGPGVVTTVIWTGPVFQARCVDGPLTITITGTAADGRVKTAGILIQDGLAVRLLAEPGKVAEPYQARVQELLEVVGRGVVKPAAAR